VSKKDAQFLGDKAETLTAYSPPVVVDVTLIVVAVIAWWIVASSK
jgi:hypothetical protein